MAETDRPRILSLLAYFWPGNEASGHNQSYRSLARALGQDFHFQVIGRDGNGSGIKGWVEREGIEQCQLPDGWLGPQGLLRLLRETPYDLLVLNGFHDPRFTIAPLCMLRLGLLPAKPVILSPRGELAAGARSLKRSKKAAYLQAVKSFGLLKNVWLHATADHEREDIDALDFECRGVLEAPNARFLPEPPADLSSLRAVGDTLKIVFLGRITPVKNLHFALEVLAGVRTSVRFDIFGPFDDPSYWADCQARIAKLPPHVVVRTMGPVAHGDVVSRLAEYDLFFLPTLGENFGHAINEALSAALPILIADTTPWKHAAKRGAGWDLPLSSPRLFRDAIEAFAVLPALARHEMRISARRFAEESFLQSDAIDANRKMLLAAMGRCR